jgi:hypothetical protein
LVATGLTRDEVAAFVMEAVAGNLARGRIGAVALRAGGVAWQGHGIIVAGPSGSGKSSLAAWLVDRGFDYLSDELMLLREADGRVAGLRRALVVEAGATERISRFPAFARAARIRCGSNLALSVPEPGADISREPLDCRLLIFPEFVAGSRLQIRTVTSAKAGLRLIHCNLNARDLADGGFGAISRFARRTAAISLTYGDFDQLQGVLDPLSRSVLADGSDAETARSLLEPYLRSTSDAERRVLASSAE